MSIRLISYIFAFAVMAILGIFVYVNNKRGRLNKVFFFFAISACLWIFSLILADNTSALNIIDIGARLAFISSTATLFLLVVLALTLAYPNKVNHKATLAFFIPAAALIFTAPTKLSIESVSVESYGAGVQGGIAYTIFSLYAGLCLIAALYILFAGIRKGSARTRAQLSYFGIGLGLTGLIALLTNLVFVSLAFLGPPSYLFLAGFTAFAVVKHRLFNLRAVVARSVAYVLLLLTLAGMYGLVLFSVTRLFFPDAQNTSMQNIANILIAVLLAFSFQPLKSFFEKLTDKIFFRDRYDSQVVLNMLSSILITEFNLSGILSASLKRLCGSLNIQNGQFFIFDDNGKVYKVEHFGPLPPKLITPAELTHFKKTFIVADELEGGSVKNIMDSHGVRLSVRLTTHDKFVGFLLLGDKLSGDIYSPQDIELLQIAAKEIAVAVTNAKAYEEIQAFNITLQEKVDDATHSLRTANQRLRELDKAKDEFISMASHQLRTPLTSIKGYLSMLVEGDAGRVTAQQKEFLNYAYGGSQRMVNLISDLLNVSRMTSGKFMIEKAPIDLNEVVKSEVEQLQLHAKAKNLVLNYIPPKTILPQIELDENKTRQVIMNFIDNAIYYTQKGTVTVSLEEKDKNAVLKVVDSGIGVPPDAQKKLFSKFYRAENAQGVRPDGTGLGLFLAKRVVEDQGGTIIFSSIEGKGSTFGFSMPLTKQ